MADDHRVLLLGGASHTGKSTVAWTVAARLGWDCTSTDKLARHPGRPWRASQTPAAPHVAAHYRELSVEELVADVTRHRREVLGPLVEERVAERLADPALPGLVLEGAGILPEIGARLAGERVGALWLAAGEELLGERIRTTSRYAELDSAGQELIDKFLARAIRFEEQLIVEIDRLGLVKIDIGAHADIDSLTDVCLAVLAEGG